VIILSLIRVGSKQAPAIQRSNRPLRKSRCLVGVVIKRHRISLATCLLIFQRTDRETSDFKNDFVDTAGARRRHTAPPIHRTMRRAQIHCRAQAAVPIQTPLRRSSPQTGNICGKGRRLSAISASSPTVGVRRRRQMREKPGFPVHSRLSSEAWPNAALAGWRRSGIRTGLHANSLLTGNFTGNSSISGLLGLISSQETPVPQPLLQQFPKRMNRENIFINRDLFRR